MPLGLKEDYGRCSNGIHTWFENFLTNYEKIIYIFKRVILIENKNIWLSIKKFKTYYNI